MKASELNFNGILECDNELQDNCKSVIIQTTEPRCRMHCKIMSDAILFNDGEIPTLGDKVDCRMRVEYVSNGNIYGTMCSWFKIKK